MFQWEDNDDDLLMTDLPPINEPQHQHHYKQQEPQQQQRLKQQQQKHQQQTWKGKQQQQHQQQQQRRPMIAFDLDDEDMLALEADIAQEHQQQQQQPKQPQQQSVSWQQQQPKLPQQQSQSGKQEQQQAKQTQQQSVPWKQQPQQQSKYHKPPLPPIDFDDDDLLFDLEAEIALEQQQQQQQQQEQRQDEQFQDDFGDGMSLLTKRTDSQVKGKQTASAGSFTTPFVNQTIKNQPIKMSENQNKSTVSQNRPALPAFLVRANQNQQKSPRQQSTLDTFLAGRKSSSNTKHEPVSKLAPAFGQHSSHSNANQEPLTNPTMPGHTGKNTVKQEPVGQFSSSNGSAPSLSNTPGSNNATKRECGASSGSGPPSNSAGFSNSFHKQKPSHITSTTMRSEIQTIVQSSQRVTVKAEVQKDDQRGLKQSSIGEIRAVGLHAPPYTYLSAVLAEMPNYLVMQEFSIKVSFCF